MPTAPNSPPPFTDVLSPQTTADGSLTFFSGVFQEAFHSHYGAKQEAESKFVQPCQIGAWAKTGQIRILDICYGLGYNTAAVLAEIWRVNSDCWVELWGLELNPVVCQAAIAQGGVGAWDAPIQAILRGLATNGHYQDSHLQARLVLGDARQTIQHLLKSSWQADVIFLDPFSPPKCPQLWTVEFLGLVSQCLAPSGYLATYSSAAAVRSALLEVGLEVGSTRPLGRKSPGTLARWLSDDLIPLTEAERAHLETKAGIPYHDPGLNGTIGEILQTRQLIQAQSNRRSSSQWRRDWQGSSTQF